MTHEEHHTSNIRDLVALLRGRWKLVTTFAMTGAILALLIGASIPPDFTAKAQLLVAPSGAGPADAFNEAVVDTHIELIVSPSHLREVQASLAADPPSGGSGTQPSPFWSDLMDVVRITLREATGAIFSSQPTETRSPSAIVEIGDSEPGARHPPDFEQLKEGINVFKEQRSRVIAVTFTADDPQSAADIANRVAENYVKRGRDSQLTRRERLEKELAERIPSAKSALELAEAAVRDYRIASGLLDPKSVEAMDRQIAELRRQIAVDLAKVGKEDVDLSPLRNRQDPVENQSELVRIFGDYQSAGGLRIGIDSEMGPDNAEERGLHSSRKTPSGVADEGVVNPYSNRSAHQERLNRTIQRLQALEQSRESLREAETRLRELEREAGAAAQLYESLLRKQTEFTVQDSVQQDVHIVSAAMPPERPSSPPPILFVLPAFVAFAISGGLMVVVMDRFDRRIRGERDVEEFVGVPCIGLLPRKRRFQMRRARHNLIDQPFNIYGEAVRSLVATALSRRRVPSRTRPSRNCAVFAVTSSEQHEGKTTLAVSFAVSAGMLGRRVLLVDLDFRSTRFSEALGSLGTDIPAGETAATERAVRNMPELGIDWLPLADRRENALSFLSKCKISAILEELRGEYDCIVIDSPPLLGATETRTIAAVSDNVIFAMKWGSTEIDTAGRALRQLQHAGIKDIQRRVFGVITQVNPRKHRFYQ